MARLNSLSTTWEEYKGWFFLALSAYVLYSFRGVFSAVGGAAGSGADALLGGIQSGAQVKADKAKAKASNGGKVDFTDEQIAQFTADAQSLATYLGRGDGFGLQNLVKDQQSAFTLLKQRYSRLNLYNNKPCKWSAPDKKGKKTLISQTAETKDSIHNAVNWRALVPFYRTVSGGHDLQADVRYYVADAKYKALLSWIL